MAKIVSQYIHALTKYLVSNVEECCLIYHQQLTRSLNHVKHQNKNAQCNASGVCSKVTTFSGLIFNT
jgi:hypothetical protein